MLGIQCHPLVFNIDIQGTPTILVVLVHKRDEVAHLALQGDVGDEALLRLGVRARQVTSVGVPIRVAVGYVEDQDEVVFLRRVAVNFRLLLHHPSLRFLFLSARLWARWW